MTTDATIEIIEPQSGSYFEWYETDCKNSFAYNAVFSSGSAEQALRKAKPGSKRLFAKSPPTSENVTLLCFYHQIGLALKVI